MSVRIVRDGGLTLRAVLPGVQVLALLGLVLAVWAVPRPRVSGDPVPVSGEVFLYSGWAVVVLLTVAAGLSSSKSVPDTWWTPMTAGVTAGWFLVAWLAITVLTPFPAQLTWFFLVVNPIGLLMGGLMALWQGAMVRPGRTPAYRVVGTFLVSGVVTTVTVFLYLLLSGIVE
ncbi:hypothetical protein V5P93_006566 [Actinokineospora auranticolor]|uniref:Uncharacterized protein n=1 Tax=Actinokineospora auranticolor TaxID=155976 RepID=A0A2S6GX59_9PSEU|nr:hypothetical protein [Actinokineospora auranticolor]PPK69793.1 hypothetical protein CLV40_103403 [Actinokineospora auranticolor]